MSITSEAFGAPSEPASPLGDSRRNQASVTLFGQPCTLSGPFSVDALKALHSISPEQMPSPGNESEAKQQLQKLLHAKQVPQGLESYRERLKKRLEGYLAFFSGLSEAKKNGRSADLLSAAKKHLKKKHEDFDEQVKQAGKEAPPTSWSAATIEKLQASYLDLIEPSPEEDFHRATQRMSVEYSCSFEEEAHPGVEDEELEE